jgi:hypothetical protein
VRNYEHEHVPEEQYPNTRLAGHVLLISGLLAQFGTVEVAR